MSLKAMGSVTLLNVNDGAKGDQGNTTKKETHQYYLSTSPTSLSGGSWSETQPEVTAGTYLWERDKITLTDNTVVYSDAVYSSIIDGVLTDVDSINNKITNKVWESDITTKINQYDGSTVSTMRNRLSQTEQDISGITTRVSDVETTTGNLGTRMTSAESSITQNSNKISAMVTVDGETSELTLTDKMIEAVTEQFVVKSPDGRRTVISGGLLLTDAIQSNNYQAPTGNASSSTGTYPYSVNGSLFDLSNGNIYTPNFMLDSVNGNAYLSGTIETGAGHIGGFVITENSIYHNKRNVSSVDLDDSVYIINNDPYVLDDEDYLYGGYATLYEVYMGTDGISCGFGKFAVDSTGELFASDATIQGNITATSLNVGSAGDSNHLIYNSTTGIDLSTDWLKFDSTAEAVIIGNNNNAMSANISGSDFILKDKDSNPFFYAGDLRGGENAKITESIVAGTRFNYIRLDVSYKIETSDEVTVTDSNGNTIQCTIGSNGYYLTSDDLIDGDTYTVVYYTAEPLYAITFTQRDPNYGTVIGVNSVNFAYNGRCSGSGAFCEGYATTASGKFSHAEGRSSRASGDYSHAEGESFAESRDAHAEGGDCYARGGWSHAEGYKCESNATYSHAGGFYSKAEGYKSYARGDNVVAQGCSQFVIGKYNDPQGSETTIDNSDYAFIIGNGTSSVLSNALTVDWKGVTSYYGDVTNASLQVPPNSSVITSITYATNSDAEITEIAFTKKGNLAMLRFQVTSTNAISSGSNIFTAQLASKYHPAQYTTGVGYYGGHAIVGRIDTDGQIIIRNASSSGVTLSTSNNGVEVAFTYILKDYFAS